MEAVSSSKRRYKLLILGIITQKAMLLVTMLESGVKNVKVGKLFL
jgi:hypothetical protein